MTAAWRKSSYSAGNGGECLEVQDTPAVTPVRDSKQPNGPRLVFSHQAWAAFVASVKKDSFRV